MNLYEAYMRAKEIHTGEVTEVTEVTKTVTIKNINKNLVTFDSTNEVTSEVTSLVQDYIFLKNPPAPDPSPTFFENFHTKPKSMVIKNNSEQEQRALESWTDSEDVVFLFNYLKRYKQTGVKLVEIGGQPCLHCDPQIMGEHEIARIEVLHIASLLIRECQEDLKFLMKKGLIHLRKHPFYK